MGSNAETVTTDNLGISPGRGRPKWAEAELALIIADRLRTAASVDDEVAALAAALNERGQHFVLCRWGYHEWPPPTLDVLGERAGVTRERVRQIVALHESRLRGVSPNLPLASAAVATLTRFGGVLTESDYRDALAATGVEASPAALRTLPTLGELGLIAAVHRHEASSLWMDAASASAALERGDFEQRFSDMLTKARRALRRMGAMHVGRLNTAPPLSPVQAAELAAGSGPMDVVSNYYIPHTQSDSTLSKCITKMLAVVGPLRLDAIRRGLRRLSPKPIKLPVTVIEAVLGHHAAFALERGYVRLVVPISRGDVLNPAELAVVEAMEARGNALLLTEMQAILAAGGHSSSRMLPLSRAPYLARVGHSLYALRGHPLTPETDGLRSRTDGRLRGHRAFLEIESEGNARYTVRYRLTPAALRGAFRVPKRVAQAIEAAEGEWAVAGGGPPQTLSIRRGLIWDASPWFAAIRAREGDHVLMTLDLETRTVQLVCQAADEVAKYEAEAAARMAAQREAERAERERRRRDRLRHESRVLLMQSPQRAPGGGSDQATNRPVVDLATVRFFQFHGHPVIGNVLIAAFTQFPLTPGTAGVRMCVLCRLDVAHGQQRFTSGLFETAFLEQGIEITAAEALSLLPTLGIVLLRKRVALAWREYRGKDSAQLDAP